MLKEYLIRGAAINKKRLQQLGQAVEVMKRVSNSLDAEQILDVVETYSAALDLLDDYDHQCIGKPKTSTRSVELTYEDCRAFIKSRGRTLQNPHQLTFSAVLAIEPETPLLRKSAFFGKIRTLCF